MGNIVQILMNKIIDYAGLFPPAQLDLETSLKNYTSYKKSEDNWALSHFVIPLRLLENFPYENLDDDLIYSFSVLLNLFPDSGTKEMVAEHFLKNLSDAINVISEFERSNIQVSMLEIKLDHHIFNHGEEFLAFIIKSVGDITKDLNLQRIFFEVPMYGSTEKMFLQLVAVLSVDCEYSVGIKIRTGGTESHLFPSLQDLSGVIQICSKYGVAMKATAGLHKHIRHLDDELGVWRYGFLNIFAAMMLASKHKLARQIILEILSDNDVTSFSLCNEFGWKDFKLTGDELSALRTSVAISFGSCDFVEPLDYLRDLGFLT